MSKNNNEMLCKTLLKEGKCLKREVIEKVLYLTVQAFGHTYTIKAPYTKQCKITQEK